MAHVYELTRSFPREERLGLIAQLRRAALSIPSNIAEGAGRSGNRTFAHSIRIAVGSASEGEAQLYLARDPGFGDRREIDEAPAEVQRIRKMLWGLREHYEQME